MTQAHFRSFFLAGAAAIALAACGGDDAAVDDMAAEKMAAEKAEMMKKDAMADAKAEMAEVEVMSNPLADAIANADVRGEAAMARDAFRRPAETLAFFGFDPSATVVEVWPGGGWYTDIIAPAVAAGGGTYIAAGFPSGREYYDTRNASFREKYMSGGDVFGDVQQTALGADTDGVAPAGSADLVLTFRNVHNWKMNDFADKAFADFYSALKPGGILGVVEHRLPEDRDIAEEMSSGYMKQSSVLALASAAGFELVEASEINANAADTADHPFGVWTLPPSSRTSGRDGSSPEGFDAEAYKAIGESDRMTLKFRKPVDADGALLE